MINNQMAESIMSLSNYFDSEFIILGIIAIES